jgi:hypothetical protein
MFGSEDRNILTLNRNMLETIIGYGLLNNLVMGPFSFTETIVTSGHLQVLLF